MLPKHSPIRAGILDGQHVLPGDAVIGGAGHNDVARRIAHDVDLEPLIGRVAHHIAVALHPRLVHERGRLQRVAVVNIKNWVTRLRQLDPDRFPPPACGTRPKGEAQANHPPRLSWFEEERETAGLAGHTRFCPPSPPSFHSEEIRCADLSLAATQRGRSAARCWAHPAR